MSSPGQHPPNARSSNAPLRLFISTGEVSGDLQGALLITALLQQAKAQALAIHIEALGGDRMAAAGATLIGNTTRLSSIGLIESLPYVLPTIQMQNSVQRSLLRHPPDAVILIDYRSPNLKLGQFIRRHLPGTPIIYYIAPQEWVWSFGNQNTHTIANITDQLLAIFPQEAIYFQKHGVATQWVGHPLIDQVQSNPTRSEARHLLGIQDSELAIALLPASRQQELRYLSPVMFSAAQLIQAQLREQNRVNPDRPLFWIPLSLEAYRPILAEQIAAYGLQAEIVPQSDAANPDWLRRCAIASADLAITKSGTVNLELALMQVPQVVIYRVSPITAWVARYLLRFSIPFMSPVNLVDMKQIVPELLQEQASPERIRDESLQILLNSECRQQIWAGYARIKQALGEPGACDRAAQAILNRAQQSRQSI